MWAGDGVGAHSWENMLHLSCEQFGFNKTKCHLLQQINTADGNFICCPIVLFLSSLRFVWVLLLFKV